MRKFNRLIRNEWKKLFKRAPVWVMLSLLVLIGVGFSLVTTLSSNTFGYYYYSDAYTPVDEAEEELPFLEKALKDLETRQAEAGGVDGDVDGEGDGNGEGDGDITVTWYVRDDGDYYRRRIAYYEYIVQAEIRSYSDWRLETDLTDRLLDAKFDETPDLASLETIFLQNDYKGYLKLVREENNVLYADEPETLALENWLCNYCIDNDVIPSSDEWRYSLVEQIATAKKTVAEQEALLETTPNRADPEKLEEAKNICAVYLYRLDHDMETNPADCFKSDSSALTDLLIDAVFYYSKLNPFWNAFSSSATLVTLCGLFLFVIAGSIVSSEYSQGTVKFLLITPVKRWKILTAKYATVLSMGLMFLVILFAVSFGSSAVFAGVEGMFDPAVLAKNGVVYLRSPFLLLLRSYALTAVEILISATLAFAISSLMRSSALAIGISMFVYFTGSLITLLFQTMHLDWARYLLFSNTDLYAVYMGNTGFPHQSFTAALIIVGLHMFVFLLTAWDAFTRKEV